MKIEAEKMSECVATEELVRELVRNDARRGEYMIMMDDADEERFVQIACDYDDAGVFCHNDDFDLEYRDGKEGQLFHCTRRVSADEVERIFLDELAGRGEWRSSLDWEKENVGGGLLGNSRNGVPPGMKILNVVGGIVFFLLGICFLVPLLIKEVKAALIPGAEKEHWIAVIVISVFAYLFICGPAMAFAKWLKTRGTKRMARERMIPVEGIRLKRQLPIGLLFMAFWCCVFWNAIVTKGRMVGIFGNKPGIGIIHQLIGTGITAYLIWLVWKYLCPSYEVRLAGGMLKEGERATFEYRFKGDAEKVERVVFATAACAAGNERNGSVDASPGDVNDAKEFTYPLEIASGHISLELPRIAEDCHAEFKYYFRATVVFKSGRTIVSSYRIPLT